MKEGDEITVWITRYALTDGIWKKKVRVCRTETMIDAGRGMYFHGKDWHITENAAKERAQEMLGKKIKSMERQIEKLKKMEISIVDKVA